MAEVKGIGDEAPEGWVLEEYETPMPKGISEILDAIKHVLQQGKIQSVLLKLGSPIRFTRFIKQEEVTRKRKQEGEGEMKLGEAARNVQLEEFQGKSKSPSDVLLLMMLALEMRQLHLSFVGVGANTRLFEWLGLDQVAYGGIENLGGALLVRDNNIPDEALIMFGSPYRQSRVDQVTYAIKTHMFLVKEDLPQEEPDE